MKEEDIDSLIIDRHHNIDLSSEENNDWNIYSFQGFIKQWLNRTSTWFSFSTSIVEGPVSYLEVETNILSFLVRIQGI